MSSPPAETQPAGSYFLGASSFSVYEEMARQLQERHWKRKTDEQLHQCDLILGDRFLIKYSRLRTHRLPQSSFFHGKQLVNYFQGSHKLTLKASMALLLRETDRTCASWLPQSFVVGGDPAKVLDERHELLETVANNSCGSHNVWIIKPSSGAKGEDIVLVSSLAEVEYFIASLNPLSKKRYVVQRYVDKPLLLSHGRKFDIRAWVLLLSPRYDIYVYTQASCRTASTPYDASDVNDRYAHLTNHCIQQESSHYGVYEAGNEMWLPELQAYLTRDQKSPWLSQFILPGMSNIIVRSLLSMRAEMKVYDTDPFSCFQLFGYDFIVEDNHNVRLLEINGSPGIAQKHLRSLVAKMLTLLQKPSDSREWDIHSDDFVLLWREGIDPFPESLSM